METFLNPDNVLTKIDLRDNMVAADFGSGSGGWVIPLAKKLEDGRVFAIDILEEPLSALRVKAQINKLSNIKTFLADVEKKIDFFDQSCDLILMTNLLFQTKNKKNIFKEAQRILKNKGSVLVVDWKENPPIEIKTISPEEVKGLGKEFDFILKDEFEAGPYHYALLFTKS